MGERSEYTPGTFCSVDLAAADTEKGKAFYTGLSGNIFVAQDSQGAAFGLFEGELEP